MFIIEPGLNLIRKHDIDAFTRKVDGNRLLGFNQGVFHDVVNI